MSDDWRAINNEYWDDRADAHAAAPSYAFDEFVRDPGFLSEVVRFDRPRLGDVSGRRGVHLQCHIGTDTVSLARLGAHMSGLDFSAPALAQATRLAALTGQEIDFHQSDVYSAVEVFGPESFDFVYTGVGALCWLPAVKPWARVVAGLLRPGGRLFIREGHPMLWALDERVSTGISLDFPYFETAEPLVWEEAGSYAGADLVFSKTTSHSWNHGLGEVVTALLETGLTITGLVEHDSAPWDGLPGQMVKDDAGEWRLADRPERLAATYTLQAHKPDLP